MAGDDDHVSLTRIVGGHLTQPWEGQHIEVPHLIYELAIISKFVGNMVVRPASVLSRVEILIRNHNAEVGFVWDFGRAELMLESSRALHATDNESFTSNLQ